MDTKTQLCVSLLEVEAVKFGSFRLKSGMESPIYIDLRVLVSYPPLLKAVAGELRRTATPLKFDRIAGIPYAALAIATALSLEAGWPMVYPRKEAKAYGTKAAVEGAFKEGDMVLVVDDLITDGGSKLEAIQTLKDAGLRVRDIAVLVDREQGGKETLAKEGYKLHAVLTAAELLDRLRGAGKISEDQFDNVRQYFADPAAWRPRS